MQVINPNTASDKLWEQLGTGLQQLAQNKLASIQKQHQQAQYAQFFGPGVASLLSNADPEMQKVLIQNPDALLQLKNIIDQRQGQNNGMMEAQQAPQEMQQNGIGALQGLNVNDPDFLTKQALSRAGVPLEALLGRANQQQVGQQNPQQPQVQPQQTTQQAPANESEKDRLLKEALTSPKQRVEQEKLNIQKEEHARKGSKDVREYLEQYEPAVVAADNDIRDYKVIEQAAKSGKLRNRTAYQIMSKFGIQDLGLGYESQIVNKLVARLAQNSQAAFGPGTRITNYLERTFQRSIPTLENSPEAIEGIAKMNRLVSELVPQEQDIRVGLIKGNKGRVPEYIGSEVRDKMRKPREQVEDEIMKIAEGLIGSDQYEYVDKLPEGYTGPVTDTETGRSFEV